MGSVAVSATGVGARCLAEQRIHGDLLAGGNAGEAISLRRILPRRHADPIDVLQGRDVRLERRLKPVERHWRSARAKRLEVQSRSAARPREGVAARTRGCPGVGRGLEGCTLQGRELEPDRGDPKLRGLTVVSSTLQHGDRADRCDSEQGEERCDDEFPSPHGSASWVRVITACGTAVSSTDRAPCHPPDEHARGTRSGRQSQRGRPVLLLAHACG